MKRLPSKQANSRDSFSHSWSKGGYHNTLRLFVVILLSGFLSAGSTAWAQTRSTTNQSSRTPSRTEKASDARTEKKAAETRSSGTRSESVRKESDKREESVRKESTVQEAAKQQSTRSQATESRQETTRSQAAESRREPDSFQGTARQEDTRQREAAPQNADRQGRETQQQREAGNRGAGVQGDETRRLGVQGPTGSRGDRSTTTRVAPTTRLSSGYRVVPGNRKPDRIRIQLPDLRFKHDYERCDFCFGVGFLYSHDRLHKLRCTHCYGRGFAMDYLSRLDDVCPICYGPVSGFGQIHRRSMQNCARFVTDRLDYLLDLSRSQERDIYRIVLDYLRESRYEDWYDLIVIRDRKIVRELSYRQRDLYLDYMNNLDTRDVCDRCFFYF